MLINSLNNKIAIQYKKTEIVDGFENEEWEDYYKTWAKIKNIHGQELFIAKSLESKASSKITVRYCNKLKEINPLEYRVVFNGQIYNIISTDNIGEANEFIELLCERSGEKLER